MPVKPWSPSDSADLYNVAGWSNGYFNIGDEGTVVLTEDATGCHEVDLKAVVDDLIRRGISLPLLLRFPDILRSRVKELQETFAGKIREFGYKGRYQSVLPIKVNQQSNGEGTAPTVF